MKLLIASFAPLRPEVGAGQLALGLAASLAARGHQVTTWEAASPPSALPSRLHMSWRRAQLESFIREHGPFDAVDAPPIALTRRLARIATLVARTVQPDWLYWWAGFAHGWRTRGFYSPVGQLAGMMAQARVAYGLLVARCIYCLGPQEEAWLRRWLSKLNDRIVRYDGALLDADREALESVRLARKSPTNGLRWLWIGRFAPHKAPERALHWFVERLQTHPDDQLTFAGCGDGAGDNVLGPSQERGRIRFVPTYRRTELSDLLAAHDAGVFTSVAEGWGLSLQEMLESGMPVFATEAGGVSTLRRFFPVGLHDFPPAVDWGIRDWARAQATQEYWPRFTWRAIAERYEREVLEKLVQSERRQ